MSHREFRQMKRGRQIYFAWTNDVWSTCRYSVELKTNANICCVALSPVCREGMCVPGRHLHVSEARVVRITITPYQVLLNAVSYAISSQSFHIIARNVSAIIQPAIQMSRVCGAESVRVWKKIEWRSTGYRNVPIWRMIITFIFCSAAALATWRHNQHQHV